MTLTKEWLRLYTFTSNWGKEIIDTGLKPIPSSKLVGKMVNGVPKGTKSYIAAKTSELKKEKAKKDMKQ